MPAISINQPWAGLIVLGIKDIENRNWFTNYRGPAMIHAGLKIDRNAMMDVFNGRHPVTGESMPAQQDLELFRTGGIVGEAEIVDCVRHSDSTWFVGAFGFVLANARMTPFRPCKGALNLFQPDFTSRYAESKRRKPKAETAA